MELISYLCAATTILMASFAQELWRVGSICENLHNVSRRCGPVDHADPLAFSAKLQPAESERYHCPLSKAMYRAIAIYFLFNFMQ